MSNLAKRVLSALVFVPVVLYIAYLGGIPLRLLVALVVILAGYEFYRMANLSRIDIIVGILVSTASYLSFLFFSFEKGFLVFISIIMATGLYALFTIKDIKGSSTRISYLFCGAIYVGIFPSFIVHIRDYDSQNGFYCFLTYIAIIWLSDTFAYFVGRAIGRHKLYEKVSPKKTIEGSIGGVFGGVLAVYIVALLFGRSPSLNMVFLAGVLMNLIGQAGDLFESVFKRDFGLKDSGQLIPGHGGMLDRIDSIIFSAPFMYLIIRFLI